MMNIFRAMGPAGGLPLCIVNSWPGEEVRVETSGDSQWDRLGLWGCGSELLDALLADKDPDQTQINKKGPSKINKLQQK